MKTTARRSYRTAFVSDMPSLTKKQHGAMRAAAAGKSNLGIPKKVGKEFIAADKKAGKHKGKKYGGTVKKRKK